MKTKKTVLIAEDDANDMSLLRQAFVNAEVSCDLKHVLNGKEAVAYLRGARPCAAQSQHAIPDLLITDFKMPVMGGLELLSWLRHKSEFLWLPAVVLTSSEMEHDRAEALALGARAYYVKPACFGDLISLVQELNEEFLLGLSKPNATHARGGQLGIEP